MSRFELSEHTLLPVTPNISSQSHIKWENLTLTDTQHAIKDFI